MLARAVCPRVSVCLNFFQNLRGSGYPGLGVLGAAAPRAASAGIPAMTFASPETHWRAFV